MKDNLKFKGKIKYELRGSDGILKESKVIDNTVTEYMTNLVAHQMATPNAGSEIGFMAIGSGTGQAATDVDLSNYVSILALSGDGGLQAGSNVTYSAYWAAGAGTGSIREAGLFLNSGTTRDSMCLYNDSLTVNKGASDTLKIDWTATYGV